MTARAVALLCDVISDRGVGQRAVIRCDVRNRASARVAEKAGFTLDHEFDSATETGEQGRPVRLRVYVRLL